MQSKVAVVAAKPQGIVFEIHNAVKEAIDLLGGLPAMVKPGQTVLVKPNIAKEDPMDYTNPNVTWAICKIFADFGCKVILGENPAIPTNEKVAYEAYGMQQIADQTGATLVSLRQGEHVMKPVPDYQFFPELMISGYASEADFIISAATMKSVNVTTVSLGMKNMKGVLPSAWKRKFHTEGLVQGIVDLNSAVKPGLVIIDGTFGRDMTRGVAYPVGVIVAGRDPVATDATCTRIMGFDPHEVEHLDLAARRGLGQIEEAQIDVLGLKLEPFITNLRSRFRFSAPQNPFKIAEESGGRIEVVQGNPCSVCLNELGNSLAMQKANFKNYEKTVVFVGPNVDPSQYPESVNKIYFGNCLKKYQKEGSLFVEGCPPTEDPWITEKTGSFKDMMEKLNERSLKQD